MNKKYGFTLVEILIVVTIIGILSAIGIGSYSGSTTKARDTTRSLDISELVIKFKEERLGGKAYPTSSQSFPISYFTGNIVAKQGPILDDISLLTATNIPTDPKSEYPYIVSTRTSGTEYQISATLENDGTPKALVRGDFKTVAPTILPSLIVASTAAINVELSANKGFFVLDGSTKNIAYHPETGVPAKTHATLTGAIQETGVSYLRYSGYTSGIEIFEASKLYGTGYYLITNPSGSVVQVRFNGNGVAF